MFLPDRMFSNHKRRVPSRLLALILSVETGASVLFEDSREGLREYGRRVEIAKDSGNKFSTVLTIGENDYTIVRGGGEIGEREQPRIVTGVHQNCHIFES